MSDDETGRSEEDPHSGRESTIVDGSMAEEKLNGEATPNVRGAFDMFDLDGSGEISVAEFGTVIRSLGENPTDDEIEEMLKSEDRDLNGTLDFEEFQRLYSKRMESRKDVAEDELFRDAFKVFDKDGSGKISKEELRTIVTSYGKMKLTEEDADEMLSSTDVDGDGYVDYEEFVKMFTDKGIFNTAEP